jgi:CubicO group peptidase (beta-lactamase class C family)
VEALRLIDDWPGPAAVIVVGKSGEIARRGPVERKGRWASVTKLFTAYATLIALEEGLLDLDQAAGPPGATLRHLLAHASGLPLEGEAPVAPPASRRIYSNAGIDLVGRFLSAQTGADFDQFLQQRVLGPLEIEAEMAGRPSEGLVGDTTGIARLARDLLNPVLVDPDTIVDATTVAFPGLAGILPGVGRFDPLDWGLGFEVRSSKRRHWTGAANSPRTFGHFGGSGSFLWVDPASGVGLACLSGVDFDAWALRAWPQLSDRVLAEATGSAGDPRSD